MEVKLAIFAAAGQCFSQTVRLPCVVGRGKQCDVAIIHPLVSRRHCEIYAEGERIQVRDLGSLNGTFFRGERIGGGGVVLPPGETFSIGALDFRVEDAASDATKDWIAPPEDAPAPPSPPSPTDDLDRLDLDRLDVEDAPGAESDVLLSSGKSEEGAKDEILDLADFFDDEEDEDEEDEDEEDEDE